MVRSSVPFYRPEFSSEENTEKLTYCAFQFQKLEVGLGRVMLKTRDHTLAPRLDILGQRE